jgi:hypothetical protein
MGGAGIAEHDADRVVGIPGPGIEIEEVAVHDSSSLLAPTLAGPPRPRLDAG